MENNLPNLGSIKSDKTRKGRAVWLMAALMIMIFAGCRVEHNDSHEQPPVFVTHIVSDQSADGDIAYSPPATYIVTSAVTTGTVLAGIDPSYVDEFRGFLDFALGGAHGVPLDASIESATLEIFINSVIETSPGDGMPLLVDLVSFQPPNLIASDYDRSIQPSLLSLPVTIVAADAGTFVAIDVTALMVEAQAERLPDFQLRFLLDTYAASGQVEIEDSVADTAPILTVRYY